MFALKFDIFIFYIVIDNIQYEHNIILISTI